jgi:hypothetical protein
VGRHSRPDDDDEVAVALAPTAPSPARPGRHARTEDEPQPAAVVAPVVAGSKSTELVPAEPASSKVVARLPKGNQSTAADIALLREHSALRARVIAAIVAPFVIYTAVMYLISAFDVYFIWVWIPLVSAGVVAGGLLDAAHRRHN